MSKNKSKRSSRSKADDIIVRAKRRQEPDLRRLARALIALAQQELEAEAKANNEPETSTPTGSEEAA